MARRRWGAPLRAALLTATAVAVTVAATRLDVSASLAPPQARAALLQADVLVDSAMLACPGQLRLGTTGIRDVRGAMLVAASAAPLSALDPLAHPVGAGRVALSSPESAAGDPLGPSTQSRSTPAHAVSAGPGPVFVEASGALAPGVIATQTWERVGDDDRGLAVTPCARPTDESWLIAGGPGAGRTERLVVSNPGANSVTVTVAVHGAAGVVAPDRPPVTIPPRSRADFSVDAMASGERTPALHVVARGGLVSAVLVDSFIEGATARGVDATLPAAEPAREVVLPGMVSSVRTATLRILNPGPTDALAQVKVVDRAGSHPVPQLRAVPVPAGATRDVAVPLQPDSGAIVVAADAPVTAAAVLDQRATTGDDRMGDFAWAPAAPALPGIGGVLLPAMPPNAARRLVVTAAGTSARVTVTIVADGAERQETLTVGASSAAYLDLGAADGVWVTGAPGVRAAVTVSATRQGVPVNAVVPLVPAVVSRVSTPVRRVAD